MKKCRPLFLTLVSMMLLSTVLAQNVTITGTITDASNGEPLGYSTVHAEGTTIGASADANGVYSITVPAKSVLIFSFVGYETVREEIGNRIRIDVRMENESNLISEVVVMAYGVAPKESVTGAISSVNAQKIEKRVGTSVLSALEGNATGITLTSGGGAGSTPEVRIRGYTSVTGSNAPLYVVDGVPMAGNIQDFNPQDVESISVLKDAAAASLYGNRASNGVIIVTTKRGKSQNKANVRVSMSQGIYSRAIPDYELINADEFMETMWTGYYNYFRSNPKEAAKYTPEEAALYVSQNLIIDKLKYNIYNKPADQLFDNNGKLLPDASVRPQYNDLDWWDELERLGHRQEYHISADAASEKSSFYISAGYLNEKGYVKRDDYQRFTARSNLSLTPKKWLTLNLNLEGSHQISNNQKTGTGIASPFYTAKRMSPIYPVYLHDMDTGDFILDDNGNKIYDDGSTYNRPQVIGRHVIWENHLDKDKSYRTTLGVTGSVTIRFLKDFTFSTTVNTNLRNTENKIYDNSIIGDGKGANGRAGSSIYRYMTITAQEQLNWKRSFDLHNIEAMAVHENFQNDYNRVYTRVADETFFGEWDMNNFNSYTSMLGYDKKVRTESYLGRLRYNYDSKYFFEASIRRDGSSRFHPDHRWGNFWSVGGSWSIHRENFMLPLQDKINSLRLRTSYGEVGNDRGVDEYGYMGLYTLTTNAGKGASYKTQNEASRISWETSASWGVALEGRLYNRVNFEVEYFSKKSRDMLFKVQMPLSVGSVSPSTIGATQTINQGDMVNRGVEFSLGVDVLRRPELNWNVSLSGTYIKNKITKLPEEMVDYIDGNRVRKLGKPLYNWYLRDFAGVDQMTGRALYHIDEKLYPNGLPDGDPKEFEVEINGTKYTTSNNYARKSYFGSAIPNFYGSIGTSLDWKNLTFSILCTYSLGGKMMDQRYNRLMSVSESPSAIHKDVLKSWNGIPEGMTETSPDRIDPNGIPAVDFYYNVYRTWDHQKTLQKMDYFSIRNINLSYSFPKKWLQAVDLSSVIVSLGVENLWISTKLKGMNPQQNFGGTTSYGFDTNRIMTLGLNVRF